MWNGVVIDVYVIVRRWLPNSKPRRALDNKQYPGAAGCNSGVQQCQSQASTQI